MPQSDTLSKGVLAEIEVLLELFRDQPDAAERLSVILDRSPERLAQLLDSSINPLALTAMGTLLPRFKDAALDICLEAALSPRAEPCRHARQLLGSGISQLQTVPWHGSSDPTATLDVYPLLARLIASPAPASSKAELLLALLAEAKDGPVGDLLVELLFCYQPHALLLTFYKESTHHELSHRPLVLRALFRTGDALLAELLAELSGSCQSCRRMALRLIDTWARLFDSPRLESLPSEQASLEIRHRHLTRSSRLNQEILRSIRQQLTRLLREGEVEEVELAIRACASLMDRDSIEPIRAYLHSDASCLRLAAIRAVATLGDTGAEQQLLSLAETGPRAECVASIEALGHLKLCNAKELLIRLADHPEESVQCAAVLALGELGGDNLDGLLRQLASTGSVERAKAAARALYAGPPAVREPTETAKRVWEKLRGKDAKPFVELSMEAAIRNGLTQMRVYTEKEVSQRLSGVCLDFSSCRRMLIEQGVMIRQDGQYQFTPLGEAVWRTEHFLKNGGTEDPAHASEQGCR